MNLRTSRLMERKIDSNRASTTAAAPARRGLAVAPPPLPCSDRSPPSLALAPRVESTVSENKITFVPRPPTRRFIFDHFRQQQERQQQHLRPHHHHHHDAPPASPPSPSPQPQPQPQPRPSRPPLLQKRSSSLSINEDSTIGSSHSASSCGRGGFTSPCGDKKIVCFADLPPTPPRHALLADHFKAVQDLPSGAFLGVTNNLDLPPLPTPMQRFYREGKSTCLPGIYPLTPASPRPILHQSSYRGDNTTTTSPRQDSNHRAVSSTTATEMTTAEKGEEPPASSSCKLLHTIGLAQNVVNDPEDTATTASCCSSSSSSSSSSSGGSSVCSSSSKQRAVQFDPRVTVTEYEDDQDRDWYSEVDLHRFKCETIRVARMYLLKHPDQMQAYQKPVHDPITGALRTKAIFTLPGLGAEADSDDEGDDGDGDGTTALQNRLFRDPREMQALCDYEVRSVLIVDPSQRLAPVFRPSLQRQFPQARIKVISSAGDALRTFAEAMGRNAQKTGRQRGFDVVMSDQRLDVPPPPPPPATENHRTTTSGAAGTSELRGMTGSDLFRSIVEFEKIVHQVVHANNGGAPHVGCGSTTKRAGVLPDATPTTTSLVHQQWRSLLIGVSAHPAKDAVALRQSGADHVWSKQSPPDIGQCVRNQLVQSLVKKRCRRLKNNNTVTSDQ